MAKRGRSRRSAVAKQERFADCEAAVLRLSAGRHELCLWSRLDQLARLSAVPCRATQNFPRLRDALTADPASVLVEPPIVPTAIAGQEAQLDCTTSVRDLLHHIAIMPLRAPL